MSGKAPDLNEVRAKTLKLLGSTDPHDVAHITEKDLNAVYEEDGKDRVDVIYGHNMSYHYQNGAQGYAYQRGPNVTDGCGNTYWKWLSFEYWYHEKVGECAPGDARLKFTRRRQ